MSPFSPVTSSFRMLGGENFYDVLTMKFRATGGVEEAVGHARFAGNGIRVVPAVVRGGCRFELSLPDRTRGPDALRILDVSGRVVSELALELGLEQEQGPSGRTFSLPWDATDRSGRAVPAGVYFAHLDSPSSRASARFIVVRP